MAERVATRRFDWRRTWSGSSEKEPGPSDGSPPLAVSRPRSGQESSAASKAWWTLAGITVLVWAFQLFGYVDVHPWLALFVIILGAWGLGTVGASWWPRSVNPRLGATLAWATLFLSLVGLALWSWIQITTAPDYGTDEIAFDQYAAQLLAHGLNPYAHSMAPAFNAFHVQANGYTFALNGKPITTLSYPALSFLLYVPLVALGWTSQTAVTVNVLAWAVGIVLAFVLLPKRMRPLAIVVGSLSIYIGYAVGGVTDALFVPLLIGAVYRWDRFGTTGGLSEWRGPILLGLAMAVKQTPWLVLPFLVVAVGMEAARRDGNRQGWRVAGRYLAIAIGTFLIINLPFIGLDPRAWWTGVLTPIASHTVPAGQGIVGLSLFMGLGGGSLTAYSVALLLAFVVLWLGFVATYPASKYCAVLCPAVVLFFSSRSYGSYLVTLLPPAMVAAFTVTHGFVGRAAGEDLATSIDYLGYRPTWRRLRWLLGGGVAAVILALLAIFLTRPPLGIRITSVQTTGQLATVVQLGVDVTNQTDSPMKPSFTIESGGDLTSFWLAHGGPSVLRPNATAHYTLLAPNYFAQPQLTGGFQVVAFSSNPGTISRSAAYVPNIWHVSLDPDAINGPVPLNKPVVVHAEVLNQLDQPVHRSGEPVYLGQVIYAQQGLQYGEAVVNNSQPGETPVTAYTNSQGVATFVIRCDQSSLTPVYFEANLVNSGQFYPYGYSDILPIRFSG